MAKRVAITSTSRKIPQEDAVLFKSTTVTECFLLGFFFFFAPVIPGGLGAFSSREYSTM